jgi:hypothetical protein
MPIASGQIMKPTEEPMSKTPTLRAGILLGLAASAFGILPQATAARIVSEPQLAQYCAGEAAGQLGTRPTNLILLPVEKTHGRFHVYGQTDEPTPTLFECTFDGNRTFRGIDIKGGHDHGSHAAGGAPRAAINKCLQMVGVAARVEQVSPLRPGHYEIIIQETNTPRKVACTVPEDGGVIEDWVEMN